MLSAENISFRYGKDLPYIFHDFDFSCERGEKIGIFAPSGTGKTTLCKLLSGYLKHLSGSVTYKGESLWDMKGYCPVQLIWQQQDQAVNPRMKMEDVLLEGDRVSDRVIEGLHIRKEWLGRYPSEISGGELQRFSIARALGEGTEIIVADEITTMMDLINQNEIWQFLLDEADRRNLGLVAVSHNLPLLEKVTDKIIYLK